MAEIGFLLPCNFIQFVRWRQTGWNEMILFFPVINITTWVMIFLTVEYMRKTVGIRKSTLWLRLCGGNGWLYCVPTTSKKNLGIGKRKWRSSHRQKAIIKILLLLLLLNKGNSLPARKQKRLMNKPTIIYKRARPHAQDRWTKLVVK